MGLLDFNLDNLDSPGARMGLGLLAAAGPQAVPMSFGQRLAGAMGQLRAEKAAEEERKQLAAQRAMQAQMLQLQLEQAQRQKDLTQRRDNYLGALDPNAGPTIQPTMAGAMAAGLSPQEFAALNPQPKPSDFKVVGNRLVEIGPGGVREAYAPPDKPDLNSLIVTGPDGQPMVNRLLLDAKRQIARDGATSVGVSYGAPVAGVGPDGKPAFFLPPKDPTKQAPFILPGVAPANADKPTEDQSKAAGWLSQAENAYKNMLSAGFDKDGRPKAAAYPGPLDALEKAPLIGGAANVLRSADRQKFIQASSSLSEALLRAATGAGVNMDEARQKVQELTPQFGEREETTRQKMAAIPQYIQSLKVRAGAAASKMQQNSGNDQSDPLGLRK